MAYWCQKYFGYDKKCKLRTCLQKSNGEVEEAVFERRMPSDLKYPEAVVAVGYLKEICAKCKGQR